MWLFTQILCICKHFGVCPNELSGQNCCCYSQKTHWIDSWAKKLKFCKRFPTLMSFQTCQKLFWEIYLCFFYHSFGVNATKLFGYQHSSKYLVLCSAEESMPYRFWTKWGAINDNWIFKQPETLKRPERTWKIYRAVSFGSLCLRTESY